MPTPDPADLAVWRYGIISILLHRNEEVETLEEALIRIAGLTVNLYPFLRKPSKSGFIVIGTAACPR